MQHNTLAIETLLFGGSVETWIKLHDAWHAELLRTLLVLQGEYRGNAVEAERELPKLVNGIKLAREHLPAEFHATDPDRLIAASAKQCVKNAGRIVVRTPRWAMDN